MATLRDHARRYLAWRSIVKDTDELNLDKHHRDEADKNLADAHARVDASLQETYRFLLVPMQDPEAPNGLTKVLWEDETLTLRGSTYDKAIRQATREREWVIEEWAPDHLAPLLAEMVLEARQALRVHQQSLARHLQVPLPAAAPVGALPRPLPAVP